VIVSKTVKYVMGLPERIGVDEINRDFTRQTDRVQAIERLMQRIEELEPPYGYVVEQEDGEDYLGKYTPMNSPGVLTLYADKQAKYFWQIMNKLYRGGFPVNDLEQVKILCHYHVQTTYIHEQFHHLSDICGHLFDRQYDRNKEEALAVAFSYHHLKRHIGTVLSNSLPHIGVRNLAHFFEDFIDLRFTYHQPGYRNWTNYKLHLERFCYDVVQYLCPGRDFLDNNGVNLHGVLLRIMDCTHNEALLECIEYENKPTECLAPDTRRRSSECLVAGSSLGRAWMISPKDSDKQMMGELAALGVVTPGFSEMPDFGKLSGYALKQEVWRTYPNLTSRKVTIQANQMEMFAQEMQTDDLVVLILNRRAHFGLVEGDYVCVPQVNVNQSPHQRSVEWLSTSIPVEALSYDLHKAFQKKRTVKKVSAWDVQQVWLALVPKKRG